MKSVHYPHTSAPLATADPAAPPASTAVQSVRTELRNAIIRGELRPGDAVTSVQLAKKCGVSRTPAREALRMLQEEGFLRGELNRRLRVVEWSPEELEAVFAQRILFTVLCTRLTLPTLTDNDIDRMEVLLHDMQAARQAEDEETWRTADIAFHEVHLQGASATLRSDLARLYERAAMFRAMWLQNREKTLSFSVDDHSSIIAACRRRDAAAGGIAAALHLTRVALTLLADLAPHREPAAIRQALRLAGGEPAEGATSPFGKRPIRAEVNNPPDIGLP